jgi:hypothetical protein
MIIRSPRVNCLTACATGGEAVKSAKKSPLLFTKNPADCSTPLWDFPPGRRSVRYTKGLHMVDIKKVLASMVLLLLGATASLAAEAPDQKTAWNALKNKQEYVLGVYDAVRGWSMQEPDTALPFFGNHDKNALISEAIKMVDDMYDAGNGYEVVPAAQIIRLFWESSRDQENAGRNFKFSLDEAAQDYNAYFRSGGK